MKIIRNHLIALSLATFVAPQAIAAECSAQSGAATTPLLELYTSEGCSSCPPADQWLSGLKLDAKKSASQKVVPLAFHVDYWDGLGWKDRFAKAEYSARQRNTAARTGAGFVYTPQFIFNGRDFKNVNASRLNQAISASQAMAARANLSLNTTTLANGEINLQASAQVVNIADIKNVEVFIAIYENNLTSQVQAGENNGRALQHDYVVRDFYGGYPLGNKGELTKNITLTPAWKGKPAGAVIFVQDAKNGDILQSLQLPFCG